MSTIYVIGLGPGSWAGLPLGSFELLQAGHPVFLRTGKHPVVEDLRVKGIRFETFDSLYESGNSFEEVYEQIVSRLIDETRRTVNGTLVYAVPGHPSVAEKTVKRLRELAEDHQLQVILETGHSFLDELFSLVGADPIEGFVLLDALSFEPHQVNPSIHTVIAQVYSKEVASDVKLSLMEVYPDEFPIQVVRAAGVPGQASVQNLQLYELDQSGEFDHLTSVYAAPTDDPKVLHRQVFKLLDIVKTLRSPEGCPWDRKQTHQTLRKYVLEEAYEVADAIDRDEPWDLAEELGDMLLQIALHSQIASETGEFTFADVVQSLSDKMVRRHPHVFGTASAETAEEVLTNWEAIKRTEKRDKLEQAGIRPKETAESLLDQVKPSMPAMQAAHQLQALAAKVGFDWKTVEPVIDKVREETEEVVTAANPEQRQEEIGDLLFAVINLARFFKVDPEQALAKTNLKFRSRFHYIERELEKKGKNPAEATLDEMDALWEEAKK